jgi:hypothetical protein
MGKIAAVYANLAASATWKQDVSDNMPNTSLRGPLPGNWARWCAKSMQPNRFDRTSCQEFMLFKGLSSSHLRKQKRFEGRKTRKTV